MDALNGVSQQRGDAENFCLHTRNRVLRGGVGGDQFLDFGFLQAIHGHVAQHDVGDTDIEVLRSFFAQEFHGGADGSCRLRDVVHQQDVLSFDLADQIHGFCLGGVEPSLGDYRQSAMEHLGVSGGHLHASHVGGDHDQIRNLFLGDIFIENGGTEKVIDGNVKKALDLLGVQIHGQNTVHSRRHQKIGHQLGGDGHTGLIFAVLPGVPKKGKHRCDPEGTGPTGRIHHDQ